MDERYKLSPPPGLRTYLFHGEPFPVPIYKRFNSGSYAMESHTVPPPPISHHLPPDHVSAAFASASDSKGSSGFPGTVKNLHNMEPSLVS